MSPTTETHILLLYHLLQSYAKLSQLFLISFPLPKPVLKKARSITPVRHTFTKSDHPWLLMIIFYSKHFFLLVFNWDTIIERLCLLILGKSNLFGGFLTLFLPSEYGKRKCKTDHSAKFQKTHPYTHTLTLHTAHNYLRNVKLKSLLAHKKVWNPPPIHPLAVAYNVCKILFL